MHVFTNSEESLIIKHKNVDTFALIEYPSDATGLSGQAACLGNLLTFVPMMVGAKRALTDA